jgi:hypothetical protein
MLKIDHPQVYIYSYQLTRESSTQANNSIRVWANNIWEHFSQDPPPIPPQESAAQVIFFVFSILIQKGLHRIASLVMQDYLQENPNHLLSKAKKFSHSQKIEGSLRFGSLDDSEGILVRIGSPETDENKDRKITELENFNPNNLILSDSYEDWLGQTIFITYKLKNYVAPTPEKLKELADGCVNNLLPASNRPLLYRTTKLWDFPIFEYISHKGQLQVFVYLIDDSREKLLGSILKPVFELFYHRHKINKAFIDSRFPSDSARESYKEIKNFIEDLETKLVVKQDQYLHELKTNVKNLLHDCLDYQKMLQTLEDFDNTISIHVYNYQEKLSEIIEKCQLQPEELTTFSLFIEKTSPYFQRQIKGDLGYFQHGTNLIETAIASIRGIVEIEQAESDRNLQKTIQAVGFGIGAAGVVATSAPYWIKQDPEVISINKPFVSSSLNTFILIILLSLFAGLFTWSVASGWMNRKSLIAGVKPRWLGLISGGKTQTSLPSSQNPQVPISQQQKKRDRAPANNNKTQP